MDFSEWLTGELEKRGWTASELASRCYTNNATITRIINRERRVGPDIGRAIAIAFNIPPEEIFRRAGLLPTAPEKTVTTQELLYLFDQLGEADQKTFWQCCGATSVNGGVVTWCARRLRRLEFLFWLHFLSPEEQRQLDNLIRPPRRRHWTIYGVAC